jgi:acyl transferase domain-containing protein/NAD(P)H-dependent flavin oxidoreductase YrpB (nitropropane dioxygenase family)/NAD(P)-dependent dehydrogenase (short-subunit alcohol dehydrogenase family)/acyl carrier protein
MNNIKCFSLSPIELSPPGIAVATARSGGIGILDREFCSENRLAKAKENLIKLINLVNNKQEIGLRLKAGQVSHSLELLNLLVDRSHWLIVTSWQPEQLEKIIASLPASRSRKLVFEVTNIEQVSILNSSSLEIDGIVARGHESGGWVDEDPAFILCQKICKQKNLPLYVQGGIGIHTAAALTAAGAAGVVLDDQLLLMPESPLPQEWKHYLTNLSGQEAIAIGERSNATLRVLSRPGFAAIGELQKLAERLEIEEESSEKWQSEANKLIGWDEPGTKAWPVGQAVGLAVAAQKQYQTTGRYIRALLKASEEQVYRAKKLLPLQANSPLAKSHRTQYPIVQGPMTRVSDTAEFASAVASGGGLPLLALALMRGDRVGELLAKAKEMLGDRSWGVGILGFVPQALREEQLNEVKKIKPPFALIAGGRPDQAAELESQGIATYIHVPTPRLLQMFLEQGARRFVFEGRECGGHVGPLSSFVLWESSIDTLLSEVPAGKEGEIHILFAGGIHDARSAAMVSAMAAPLVERGMKIGVLMGSAYLFTQEAVECGAIVEGFQKQALNCTRTINLETGPGHASRCAVTPFAEEFYATRRRMLAEGRDAEEIKNTLEDLTLGRLRVASKGLVRSSEGITSVDESKQVKDGMYMIGQVATLRDRVVSVGQLHEDVSQGSTQILLNLTAEDTKEKPESKPSDIAIVGIGTLLPKAQELETFWHNILEQVEAIAEIPSHRWDWRLYYDSDRRARDKVYSKWGGFLEDVPFDPFRFGIPPKSLESIEPMQLLALEVVRKALVDAGEAYEKGEFDRENTAVILGASGGMADLGQQYAARAEIPRMVENPDDRVWERLPEWTEESFPGLLMNVSAGRVANRFDLGGSNFTVDAACASSLTAVDLAVKELESGRANVAIAGGVDLVQSAFAYFCFSKTQALSPTGKARSFDKDADGIVISEGLAAVVLKRLEDAERDGDRIYAVIKAVASSSDGKGLSMTAPASAGQKRALYRAYSKAGFSPKTIGLYEAHGTGTAAGDRAELETISSLLREEGSAAKSCVVGSIKTTLGHTKSSAGIVALIKAALSLYYKVLPPHSNVENPLDELIAEDSPVYLIKNPKPWLRHPDYPRRAAVSAFGFGGTNFHAVLEEYRGELREKSIGGEEWPCELIVLQGSDRDNLVREITILRDSLLAGAKPRLRDLAYSYAKKTQNNSNSSFSLSIVAENLPHLQESLSLVISHLSDRNKEPLPRHIQLNLGKNFLQQKSNNKIAFLFPGQVAQYPNMAREIAIYFPEMRQAIEQGIKQLRNNFPKLLNQYLYPPSAYSEEEQEKHKETLTDTHIAQATIGAIEAGYLDIITRLGLKPAMTAGHSYGEYAALHAAGVFSREEFIRLSEIRGRVMRNACEASEGAMAAVQATREELLARLEGCEDVVIANHNAPLQSVISGKKPAVRRVVESLQVAEIMARMLPVAGAFHSSLVESAQTSLAGAIAAAAMETPQIPVYANTTARPYDSDVEAIRNQLTKHLISPVEFVQQINAMYEAGARIFLELGPKSILTKLVSQILEGKEHKAISVDTIGKGLQGFLTALATLNATGVKFNLPALFQGRDVRQIDLSKLESLSKNKLAPTAWLVNGGSVRQQNEAIAHPGKIAPLNRETTGQVLKLGDNGSGLKIGKEEKISLPPTPYPLNPTERSDKKQTPIIDRTQKMTSPSNNLPSPMSLNRTSMSDNTKLAAYQAYQQTMRQFLELQEQVMKQFLSAGSVQKTVTQESTQFDRIDREVPVLPLQTFPSEAKAPVPPQKIVTEPILIPEKPIEQFVPQPIPVSKQQNGSNSFDRASITQSLLDLVSDRTGYPTEMLGLNQDMEAELGIDSIKRVEIFGALQKTLPEPLASTVKGKMEEFTKVKTLNGLVDAILGTMPTTTTSNGYHQETVKPETKEIDRASITQSLLDLVSDRTGYPTEMLGLNQDMEAELGIDSIKRVEIFGALQKTLPEPLASTVKGKMEEFTKVKTLNGLVDAILASTPTAPTNSVTERKEVANSLGKSKAAVAAPRYVMQGYQKPLTDADKQNLAGLFLISEDRLSVAPLVAKALQEKGASAAILNTSSLGDLERLVREIAQLRQKYGQVRGIVHLASLAEIPLPDNFDEWKNRAKIQSLSLFHLLQLCGDDLRQTKGQIFAASLLGGQFGRNGKCGPGLPLGGSSNGLLKTMMLEWQDVRAKIVDFDKASNVELADLIVVELASRDEGIEIGYCQGNRLVFDIIPAPIDSSKDNPELAKFQPQADWIVLSIGGARGITAEIIDEMLVPGMTVIHVGRSPLEEESPLTQKIEDISQLRRLLLQATRERGVAPTPVEIESRLKQLQNNRTILRNIAKCRQAGANVEYHALDVRDVEQFGNFINSLYDRFGRIDAVIQGAGIILDKLIVDKTAVAFERVFDTKVDSTYILSRYLRPESLKLVTIFASIAGRTGNRGQCDYAAANEVVNRFAWWMDRQWSNTRVMAINWGPWDVTGMASEEVNRQFRERGVIPIPPASGRKFFSQELKYGTKGETELIVGFYESLEKKFARQANTQVENTNRGISVEKNSSLTLPPTPQHLTPSDRSDNNLPFPLLPSKPEVQPNSVVTLTKTITLEGDPYLIDHRLDGKPVVPAAVALELMAQLVQAAWPDWVIAEAGDLRVWRGIVLETNAGKQVLLQARASTHADAESVRISAEILDPENNRPYYRCFFILSPQLNTPPKADYIKSDRSGLNITTAYRDYCFHGELFQLLNSIDSFSPEQIQAKVTPSNPAVWLNLPNTETGWLFDPGLVDASLQMALIWTHIEKDMGALPSKFGRVVRYGQFPLKEELRVDFRVKTNDSTTMVFDAIFIDQSDRIRLQLEDMEITCSSALKRLAAK